MTREDFSKQLRQYRELNNISLKDLCNALNALQNTVYRIEKGANNYSVEKALIYANTVNAVVVITHPNRKDIVLSSVETAINFLIMARGDTSMYKVAKDNGYSQVGIANAENGATALSIDMLLKLTEYYGYGITIRAK